MKNISVNKKDKNTQYKIKTFGDTLSREETQKFLDLKSKYNERMKVALNTQRVNSLSRPVARKKTKEPLPPIPTFEFWDFPTGVITRDPAPVPASDFDCAKLNHILEHGDDTSQGSSEDLLHINIGIDFGTSSTKTVVRMPYEPGEPIYVIPVPTMCSAENSPTLWRTAIWLRDEGEISISPVRDAEVLETLKQDLIIESASNGAANNMRQRKIDPEQAATAYLAYIIRYVRGWLLLNKTEAFVNRKPVWRVNVGMPAENYDEPKLAESYRRIVAAARLLADLGLPIADDSTALVLGEPDILDAASNDSIDQFALGIVPEAAAEMTSLAQSSDERVSEGLYMLIDVGALTLDMSTFTIFEIDKKNTYSFLNARVLPLGVESFLWFLRNGKVKEKIEEQISVGLRRVINTTKKVRYPQSAVWKEGGTLPIFFVGGGARHDFHCNVVRALNPWMKETYRNDGTSLICADLPHNLDNNGRAIDCSRMGVALGLSFDLGEIGDINSERETIDIGPKPPKAKNKIVSKDDV